MARAEGALKEVARRGYFHLDTPGALLGPQGVRASWSDDCCLAFTKRLNVDQVVDDSDSGTENA